MFGWLDDSDSECGGFSLHDLCVRVCECKWGYTVKDGMAMAQYKVTQCSRCVCVYVRVVDVIIIILIVAPASPR